MDPETGRAVMSSRELARAMASLCSSVAVLTSAAEAGALDATAEAALPELTLDALWVSDAARAFATAALGRVDRFGVLRADGGVSTTTWLAQHARLSKAEAGALVARARDLLTPELAPT